MGEYRNRKTGEVKSQGQWRADFAHMSLPRVWKAATLDALNLDPVFAMPPAELTGSYQRSIRDGVKQDSKGNWVENHVAVDMFAAFTVDGKTTSKAEQEAAYQATLDAATAEGNRAERDRLLAETDWTGMSDVTMTAKMKTYRKALRDITTHDNWPNLQEADWPTKPV